MGKSRGQDCSRPPFLRLVEAPTLLVASWLVEGIIHSTSTMALLGVAGPEK